MFVGHAGQLWPVHYNQYQRLINIVGGLYENHPGYFDDLTTKERQVLSRVFFYDYDYDSEDCPDDFPESFPDFFRDRIAGNQALQNKAAERNHVLAQDAGARAGTADGDARSVAPQ